METSWDFPVQNDTIAELVDRAFHNIGLVVTSPAALSGLQLPDDSREFLLTTGLPGIPAFMFDFTLVRTLPTIRELGTLTNLHPTKPYSEFLRCIGNSYGHVMVIDPLQDANVLLIDLWEEIDEMFVNTRVELLGACLAHYVLTRQDSSLRKDPPKRAAELRARLLEVDAPAVEHPASWWETVLEEVNIGLA